MKVTTPNEPKTGSHAWLKGETGALIRSIDWSRHPMGPIEGWPQSLRTALSICLGSDFPMALWWGPEVWQLYNDGYIHVLGGKHPQAMGQRGNVCWAEIWDVVGPIYERVMKTGESSFFSDLLLVMERNRYLEETYFTFSYSPVLDEQGGVGGNLIICTETTDQVVGERRLRTLRDLGARAAKGKNAAEACEIAAETLAANPWDIPFACIYLLDGLFEGEHRFELAGSAGVRAGCPVALEVVEPGAGGWPFDEVIRSSRMCGVDDLGSLFSEVPASPWEDPTRSALVLPLAAPGQERPTGVLVAGVNPRRALDESYRSFYQLAAGQIAAAIADARAYEEERRRAEALAELDRAKTTFFSNVSHELRTPLTLLLGPMEEVLEDGGGLPEPHRERLQTAHRNALRLLKLVNTLLDFARIEAGRIQAVYEPVDLPACTADLASVFRSAVERAGLRFAVDCPPLPEEVSAYVDREMWEKIVLNLLSNALKFTLEGEIAVRLRAADGGERLELSVSDTGVGISADELPRVFERFHRAQARVRTARARSLEGTGIGLALVQELVRLHGGEVRAESEPERGTTFTVSIPAGSDHLPADRIGSRTVSTLPGAAPYVEEALRWLPDGGQEDEPAAATAGSAAGSAGLPEARILLADDNADMREYVRRLLGRWTVETAADGASALVSALASPPDLVLADVMMPGLDGFELLRALRLHPQTATVPVILLSARAGEEARVEGLQAGADDYLVKPFSARELVARVGAHLATSRLRAEVAGRERAAREEAEAASRAKDEFLAMLSHELRNPIGAISNAAYALSSIPGSDERLDRLTGIVSRQSSHLTGLLDDLLDVARVTAGKIELRRRRVNLAEIAERCGRALEGDAGSHRLIVHAAPAWVEGDPTRLEQVLTNLVENAFKYTPPGGTIRLEVGSEGDTAVLRVQDTGVGISPHILPRIFDLFVQGERSLDRIEGGLGIGLTLVRRLVELHGGRVEASSGGRGLGSEFVVRLPLLAPPQKDAEAPARSRQSARRVLIVEDNLDAREALQMLLELEGHEVEIAADGSTGVELAARFRPDLVLLDIGLPGENGYEVARRLAEHPERSRMRVVALTGYGQEDDQLRSREAGFDLHLVKPLELARLRELLAGL